MQPIDFIAKQESNGNTYWIFYRSSLVSGQIGLFDHIGDAVVQVAQDVLGLLG